MTIPAGAPVIWMHISSLGEFEQGRPVVEAIRKQFPEKKILLTFFSPSGYTVRKNYDQVHHVCYLPDDTPENARKFLDIVRPELVLFVKYDFWFNYMQEIRDRKIPLVYFSVILRSHQYFFRSYGAWARKILLATDHYFVQNEESARLLKSIGHQNVTIAGDTRFDRVADLARQSKPMPLIEKFCGDRQVFIAGSSWEPDEAVFLPVVNSGEYKIKTIIAPHDVRPERIRSILRNVTGKSILHSQLSEANVGSADILIIDSVGILNQVYRYATLAYIGGAFGGGLHNIQEPVTFGVPVIFGPRYHKFREAVELVRLGGVFSVKTTDEFRKIFSGLLSDQVFHSTTASVCRHYVDENRGATKAILSYLEKCIFVKTESKSDQQPKNQRT
jgi:3-deoxy-D-manno-octulosonic-acid transferase